MYRQILDLVSTQHDDEVLAHIATLARRIKPVDSSRRGAERLRESAPGPVADAGVGLPPPLDAPSPLHFDVRDNDAPHFPPPRGHLLSSAPPAAPAAESASKYRSHVPSMVFGDDDAYRGGLLARTGPPTRSVRQEFALNEGGLWLPELEYVAHQPAVEAYPSTKGEAPTPNDEKAYTRDLGHARRTLDDFWRDQPRRGTDNELSRAEVVVARAYTGPWYKAINFYLRYLPVAECCESTPYYLDAAHEAYDPRRLFLSDPARPETCALCGRARAAHHRQRIDNWATCAALLYSGVVKLADASSNATVYRGVREVHVRLPRAFTDADAQGFKGGVERGAMSTTRDERVARSYAEKGAFALFEIEFTKQTRGADLTFLAVGSSAE